MLKYFSWGGGGEGGGVEVAKRMQDGRMSGVRPPRNTHTHTHTHTHTSGAKPTLAVRIKNSSESIGAPDKAKPTLVRTSCPTKTLSHLQQCL